MNELTWAQGLIAFLLLLVVGLGVAGYTKRDRLAALVGPTAQAAEVALVFLALPPSKESEGYDRPDLDLTPHQVALIKSVTTVQPQTVVILNNGAPVVMSEWIDGVPPWSGRRWPPRWLGRSACGGWVRESVAWPAGMPTSSPGHQERSCCTR